MLQNKTLFNDCAKKKKEKVARMGLKNVDMNYKYNFRRKSIIKKNQKL